MNDDTHQKFATDRHTLEHETEHTFVKGSGPGGQHRNKRETGVRLHHEPSGLTVTATERRSQHRNLDAAFERLAERLAEMNREVKERKKSGIPRDEKQRRLEGKHHRSKVKQMRRQPVGTDD